MGQRQSVQTQHHEDCHCYLLTECSIKFEENNKISPNTPKIGHELVLLIKIGKSIGTYGLITYLQSCELNFLKYKVLVSWHAVTLLAYV